MITDEKKTCNKCGIEKQLDEFHLKKCNKDGYSCVCKICIQKQDRIRGKEKYKLNKEQINEKHKTYRLNNKDKTKKRNRKYINENRDKRRKYISSYYKLRKSTDPMFKLTLTIRSSIYNSLKKAKTTKKSHTSDILGCSIEEFKLYLEFKFEPWMNWDNYGQYNGEPNFGWDIDHIIPSSSAITENDIIKLNHHTNLQPLCSYVNRDIKKDKY